MPSPGTRNKHLKKEINSRTDKNLLWMESDVNEVDGEEGKAWNVGMKGLKLSGHEFGPH